MATHGEGPGDYYVNMTERVSAFGDTFHAPKWKDTSDQEGRLTEFTVATSWMMRYEDGTFELAAKNDHRTVFKFDAGGGRIEGGASGRILMVAGSTATTASGVNIEPDKLKLLTAGTFEAVTQSGLASIKMSDAAIELKVAGTTLLVTGAGIVINAPIFTVTGTVISRGGNTLWD